MEPQTNIFKLIQKVDNYTQKKYIEHYFYNMVGLDRKQPITFKQYDNGYLSIMKDKTDRKTKGTGKFREKPWSNFLFYFIKDEDYRELFGNNIRHRSIEQIDSNGQFTLTDYKLTPFTRKPTERYINSKTNYAISKCIFDKLKEDHSFLFVRSYVYITVIIYGYSAINESQFLTYYFNTNYKFTSTVRKTGFINNVAYSYLVKDLDNELSLIEDNNKDVFDCVKAYLNQIDYTNLTAKNLSNIEKSIEANDEYILVEGSARTGKTIIALSLLRDYPDSNLLVMNYYFYLSLKDSFNLLKAEFPKDRIFHSDRRKEGYYAGSHHRMDFSFSIIDECQRIGYKFGLMYSVTRPDHRHSIFLGDNLQRLNKNSDDGVNFIKTVLLEQNKELSVYRFTNSIGIPPAVLKNIKFLLNDQSTISPHFLGEFHINIFDEQDAFLSAYKNDRNKSRHLASILEPYSISSPIGEYKHFYNTLGQVDFPYFLNSEIIENYYLSPYQMISREVENMYVYIRNNVNPENLKDFVYSQLYVLMTRGTNSLNIYCENKDLQQLLKKRLNYINEYSSKFTVDLMMQPKKGQFEVDESILDDFYKKYEISSPMEKIKERGITRLIHFTPEENVETILKEGLLPKTELEKRGIKYSFNDTIRLDRRPDSICLSVENPNQFLLNKFQNEYPDRKFKILIINPSILYSSFIYDKKVELVPRHYCNYNAAATLTKSSVDDIDIMFSENVQTKYRIISRTYQKKNIPTTEQAEIQFFGRISPEFIESIEDI